MALHELKTWPEPFAAVADGRKRYEIRKFDRPFAVNDFLHLREYEPESGSYTGREAIARIAYITPPGNWGLPDDVGVLGLDSVAVMGEARR